MWAGTAFILPWTGSLLRALPQAGGAAIGSAVFLGVAPSAAGFVLWAYAMARLAGGAIALAGVMLASGGRSRRAVLPPQAPLPGTSDVPAGDEDRGRRQRGG